MTRNKLVLFIIILIIVIIAAGFWYYQKNSYSKADFSLDILAPREATLAQEVEYTIVYKNNGEFKLEEPVLIFQFPEYSIIEDGQASRREIPLETIYPKQEGQIKLKARLLGKKDDVKEAQAWLNYRPENLASQNIADTSFSTKITSVPIDLTSDLPSKIEAGKEITFRFSYFSNTDYPLSNLGIKIEHPSDFAFKSVSPEPLEELYWDIGLLNRGEGDSITITGEIEGKVGEEKSFKAQLGFWEDDYFVLLQELSKKVKIVIPSLYITQEINGNPQYIASPGDFLHYEIRFKNIGREPFNDLFLMVGLEGKAFDFESLKVQFGDFYRPSQSIIFDGQKNPKLQFLGAQEEGMVDFWIKLDDPQEKNAVLKDKVTLGSAIEEFEIKIDSELELEQTVDYRTITWDLKNYYNDVENIKAKAVLPEEIDLTGEVIPGDAVLTFNVSSREVTWNIEELAAGEDISVSFGISDRLDKPFKTIRITGEDQWTERIIETVLEIKDDGE